MNIKKLLFIACTLSTLSYGADNKNNSPDKTSVSDNSDTKKSTDAADSKKVDIVPAKFFGPSMPFSKLQAQHDASLALDPKFQYPHWGFYINSLDIQNMLGEAPKEQEPCLYITIPIDPKDPLHKIRWDHMIIVPAAYLKKHLTAETIAIAFQGQTLQIKPDTASLVQALE